MLSVFVTIVVFVIGFIVGMVGLIADAIVVQERSALAALGLQGTVQNLVLLLLLIALIIIAFRVFGRLLAVLVTVAALVLLVHALTGAPDAQEQSRSHHAPTVSL